MELKDKIVELISTPLESEGFDLVELKLSRFKKNSRLQVFVDSDHGVNIDDCVRLSKAIETIIDGENIFEFGYVIEVSSPGLDRPLITVKDFRRRIGENLQIIFNDIEIPPVKGELVAVEETGLELRMKDGIKKIDLGTVRMGKIVI
jgi:ribosome maturation factor RimP